MEGKIGLKGWKNKMYKYLLFLLISFFSIEAKADICVYNSKDVAKNALKILEKNQKIVQYCPTCIGDNRVREIKLGKLSIYHDKEAGLGDIVLSDDKHLDLAYLYIPTQEKGLYQDVGYKLQCADMSRTYVREFLDINNPYGIEAVEKYDDKLQSCNNLKGILRQDCLERVYQEVLVHFNFEKEEKTTSDLSKILDNLLDIAYERFAGNLNDKL